MIRPLSLKHYAKRLYELQLERHRHEQEQVAKNGQDFDDFATVRWGELDESLDL